MGALAVCRGEQDENFTEPRLIRYGASLLRYFLSEINFVIPQSRLY